MGTDIFRNQLVAERLAQVQSQLPQRHPADRPHQFDHGPDPPDRGDVEDGPPMGRGDRRLHDQARLLAMFGVGAGDPIGGEVRQYRIAPPPSALRALGRL